MKTIIRKYDIYTFEELSQEAKDKARQDFNTDMDMPFLQADLREYIHEELQAKGYKELSEITPLYSLSYSQGDGLMFEGTVEDKNGNVYTIKHSGYYYHERSTEIEGVDNNGNDIDTKEFEENVYIPICQTVAKRGYDDIEYQESEECFAETCEANKFTFLKDGTLFNE
jgi:hypothetical protein